MAQLNFEKAVTALLDPYNDFFPREVRSGAG